MRPPPESPKGLWHPRVVIALCFLVLIGATMVADPGLISLAETKDFLLAGILSVRESTKVEVQSLPIMETLSGDAFGTSLDRHRTLEFNHSVRQCRRRLSPTMIPAPID